MVIAGRETDTYLSWGRFHRYRQRVAMPADAGAAVAILAEADGPLLPYGLGRSYGDSCLNEGGTLVDTRRLDRFVSFDRETGVIVCEAGVSFADLLDLVQHPLPDGGHWFLPVAPGTKYVTVGGAIANDVHGKNHHRRGTFGRHVLWLDLARSDGQVRRCSPDRETELFRATIGGLGLTGLVLRAAVQLMRVPSLGLEIEEVRMDSLDDYFQLRDESRQSWEYCASWVDVLATGKGLGRGLYTRARPAAPGAPVPARKRAGPAVPLDAPAWLLNPLSVTAFNALYGRKLMGRRQVRRTGGYEDALFPLDSLRQWNRLYGRPGFYQYQCVVPSDGERDSVAALLDRIARARQGSFLVVLKSFGPLESPGLLSFPIEGSTLALDFPNRGPRTLELLDALDGIVVAAGGRVYPAKDGRMSEDVFTGCYPALERFRNSLDPKFSSSFWRRTALKAS
jgi:FAD/FMN-containing dehydrogenase